MGEGTRMVRLRRCLRWAAAVLCFAGLPTAASAEVAWWLTERFTPAQTSYEGLSARELHPKWEKFSILSNAACRPKLIPTSSGGGSTAWRSHARETSTGTGFETAPSRACTWTLPDALGGSYSSWNRTGAAGARPFFRLTLGSPGSASSPDVARSSIGGRVWNAISPLELSRAERATSSLPVARTKRAKAP